VGNGVLLALQQAQKRCCQPVSIISTLPFVLLEGYSLTVVLLLSGLRLSPTRREVLMQLLVNSNVLLLVGATLLLMLTVREQAQLLTLKDEADYFMLINRMTGPYWFFYWSSLLWKGLLPQVFWWAKLRRSLVTTAVVAAFLLLSFFSPLLLTSHRDYLPSSWTMQPNYSGLLIASGLFTMLLGSIYGLFQQRRLAVRRR
jgi:molybdopterin-containing oxidoreductase family membrane subunit